MTHLYNIQNIEDLSGNGHLITAYDYDSRSDSDDQPYSISEPFEPGQNPEFNSFVHYNDNGIQNLSVFRWDDPSQDGDENDKIVAEGTFYDEQQRESSRRGFCNPNLSHHRAYGSVPRRFILASRFYAPSGQVILSSID